MSATIHIPDVTESHQEGAILAVGKDEQGKTEEEENTK